MCPGVKAQGYYLDGSYVAVREKPRVVPECTGKSSNIPEHASTYIDVNTFPLLGGTQAAIINTHLGA